MTQTAKLANFRLDAQGRMASEKLHSVPPPKRLMVRMFST
jgi:hypothetical protein